MNKEKETPLVSIKFFGKEYKMARQAQVAVYAFALVWLFTVMSIVFFTPWKEPLAVTLQMVYLLFVTILVFLGPYITNCLVVGKCTGYAWIVVGITLFSAVVNVLSFLYLTYLKLSAPKTIRSSSSRKTTTRKSK